MNVEVARTSRKTVRAILTCPKAKGKEDINVPYWRVEHMTPLMSGCENDDTMTVYKNALKLMSLMRNNELNSPMKGIICIELGELSKDNI